MAQDADLSFFSATSLTYLPTYLPTSPTANLPVCLATTQSAAYLPFILQ